MGWLDRWLSTRAVRRFDAIHVRDLRAAELARAGRYAEYAEELDQIARDYARETRVMGYHSSVVDARTRRISALIRAGQHDRARTEAAHLAGVLTEMEGVDGEMRRTLRARMAAAERGVEDADG